MPSFFGRRRISESGPVEVHKFGGGVLRSRADYEKAAEILRGVRREREGESANVVAVVSAKNGVTNRLIGALEDAADRGKPLGEILERLRELKAEHEQMLAQPHSTSLARDRDEKRAIATVFSRMERTLRSVRAKASYSGAQYDDFISRGEELSALVLNSHLPEFSVSPADEFIFTRGPHAKASVDMRRTRPPHINSILPGFYGRTPWAKVPLLRNIAGARSTIDRGGTDLTAVAAALKLNASRLVFWKENLLASANPKELSDESAARYYSHVPRLVAEEAAAHGASIFHHHAIAIAGNFPGHIIVKNVNEPHGEGTLLTPASAPGEQKPVIIARKDKQSVVTITGSGFVGHFGVVKEIKEALARAKVSFDMTATEERSYSFTVDSEDQEKVRRALEPVMAKLNKKFHEAGKPFSMELKGGHSLIGVIRENVTAPELSGGISAALRSADVSPEMISTGGNKVALSFLVRTDRAKAFVDALHQHLVE